MKNDPTYLDRYFAHRRFSGRVYYMMAIHFALTWAVICGILGLAIGTMVGDPEAGAIIGGSLGGLLGAGGGVLIANRVLQDPPTPPSGGWRRWADDDD